MTVAMITDTHFGVKNDSLEHVNHQIEFYQTVFFPTLKQRGVKTILHLGDLFDRRKYTNHDTLRQFRENFFDTLVDEDMHMYILIGNHDTYYKSTNDVNSPNLLLEPYMDNITVIQDFEVLDIEGVDIAMIPWINSENYEESLDFIENCDADILCGHFEIRGFEMHRGGGINTGGLKAEIFKRFDKVYSGHFHEPSTDGRIYYLGAPYEYTWADHGCDRGFYFFDPVTLDLDYHRNPLKMHHRIIYDDFFDRDEIDVDSLEGKVVHIIVSANVNQKEFETFVELVQEANPYEFKVIDNTDYHIAGDDSDVEAIQNEDTLAIAVNSIEASDTPLDREKLTKMFTSLYMEAVSIIGDDG